MRRKLILLFAIALLVINNIKVYAEQITCEYEDLELTMTYDTEKEFDINSNPFVEKGDYNSNSQPINLFLVKWGKNLNSTDATEIDQNLYNQILGNYACPTGMQVCVYVERSLHNISALPADLIEALFVGDWDAIDGWLNLTSKLLIMTDDEYRKSDYSHYVGGRHYILGIDFENGFFENIWDFTQALTGVGHEGLYAYKETLCQVANYNGPYIGVNINCPILQNKILVFIDRITAYKNCGSDTYCKSQALLNVNETEEGIKSQCRSILENYNYSDGEAECVDACLKIKDTLDEYKAGTDLAEEYNSGDCGFSERLLVWASNILRWIKYILPVAVIIFGILDFIKAIGADKDDEMKKAQKRFIIRLIAAALVFIIPLILEFVLDKMGFGYNDCGLF